MLVVLHLYCLVVCRVRVHNLILIKLNAIINKVFDNFTFHIKLKYLPDRLYCIIISNLKEVFPISLFKEGRLRNFDSFNHWKHCCLCFRKKERKKSVSILTIESVGIYLYSNSHKFSLIQGCGFRIGVVLWLHSTDVQLETY